MYRLLIADDEPIIRNGLMSGIDWESLGFVAAASFSCGNDVIEYLKNNSADALLSDIVMNRGSGLDAAEWIEKNRPDMCVALFTGYSDFNAACRAVSCKAVKYLLSKPTQLADLRRAFAGMAQHLEKNAAARANDSKAQLIRNLFQILETDSGSQMEDDAFVAARLPSADAAEVAVPEFRVEGAVAAGFPVRLDDCTLAIWHCSRAHSAAVEASARMWAEMVFPGQDFQAQTFRGVREMLARYASLSRLSAPQAGRDDYLRQVDEAFESRDFARLPRIFQAARDAGARFDTLSLMAEKAEVNRMAIAQRDKLADDGILHARLAQIAARGQDAEPLVKWADDLAKSLAPGGNRDADLMLALNRYLDGHLSEGLLLQDVAQALFFSAGYLSRLIKEKTGMNFSEYVLRFKIARAKEYLASTTMKVQEIGLQVGYIDTRHFARMFKRVTGSTPSQYRHSRARGMSAYGKEK